jgi:hypothetical protein
MLDWLLGDHYRYSPICSSGYDDSTMHTLVKVVLLLRLFTFAINLIKFLNLFIYYSYIRPMIYKSFLFGNVE